MIIKDTAGTADHGAGQLRDRILDCAVGLADAGSWEAVRLHQVAEQLGIGLTDIHEFFSEKDQLIDAWFDRADRAALMASRSPGFGALPTAVRLETVILAWLDHLAPHRKVARQMIGAKAEFGHVHIQIPALMRISRTVQWFREAAGCSDSLPWRAIAESAHTGIYLATFTHWMFDDSPGSERTRRLLHRLLAKTTCALPWEKQVSAD